MSCLQTYATLFASLADQVWGDNALLDKHDAPQCMLNMILEGVAHLHGVHVMPFSLPGYADVAEFKEALASAEGAPATIEVATALLQHFCRVFKATVLLWTPCLNRPILYCKPSLLRLEALPPLQGYHVAMLGGRGSLQFVSIRPRPLIGDKPPQEVMARAATARPPPRHRPATVKLPGAAPPSAATASGAARRQMALVVDTNSLVAYSKYLCSQTKGFIQKPHAFYLKLKVLAERGVVRATRRIAYWRWAHNAISCIAPNFAWLIDVRPGLRLYWFLL